MKEVQTKKEENRPMARPSSLTSNSTSTSTTITVQISTRACDVPGQSNWYSRCPSGGQIHVDVGFGDVGEERKRRSNGQ